MPLFDELLPSYLVRSRDKQSVVDFLLHLVTGAHSYFMVKEALLQWGQFNDIPITGHDIEQLKRYL